ncbi:hypothetical protein [Chlamydia avium]|nr:hypothetical protein [Chlamydia avium]
MTVPISQTSLSSPAPVSPRVQLQQRKLATFLCAISFISMVLFAASVFTAISTGCAILWTLPVGVAVIFVLSVLLLRRLCPKSIIPAKLEESTDRSN